jgi:hypothetical protein
VCADLSRTLKSWQEIIAAAAAALSLLKKAVLFLSTDLWCILSSGTDTFDLLRLD